MKTFNMNRIFRATLLISATYVLVACMWLSAARDDLSVLGNDVFSELIRKSYVGASRLDKSIAQELATEAMRGKTAQEVIDLFTREGGNCNSFAQETPLVCEVVRTWKLKNIGAPMDTKYWSDPAAKLRFRFVLSEADVVVGLVVAIIDATIYKKIGEK